MNRPTTPAEDAVIARELARLAAIERAARAVYADHVGCNGIHVHVSEELMDALGLALDP